MSIITFFLSAVLMAVGAYALVSGFDIVTTERGLALTLCGTMALSIGSVVLALGFILVKLRELKPVMPTLEDGPYFKPSPDLGLRSDLPDEISDNLDDMKAAKSTSRPALNPYTSASALAAGAGIMATAAGDVSTHSSKDKADIEEDQAQQDLANPENLANPKINAPEHSVLGENQEAEIRVPAPDSDTFKSKSLDEHSGENGDDTFADLDKLIDELAIETSVDAHAEPDKDVTFANIQQVEGKSAVSTFEAELHSQTYSNDPTEDTLVAHILPSDTTDDVHEPYATASEAEIIGAYDSGGVTYTLYSDGGVVAEAGDQREEYASLEALKAALENGKSVFKS